MKYFVISDVHSFFTYMKEALDKVGYDPTNKDHFLINCGDLFDRGEELNECLEFIMSIPKERRILITGNHEDNLIKLLDGFPAQSADEHNGTIKTIFDLASQTKETSDYHEALEICRNNQLLQDYLYECKDYYELNDYLFVHGWYPHIEYYWYLDEESIKTIDPYYYRTASVREWADARWMCGFSEWDSMKKDHEEHGMPLIDKTVVCGHWHTSYAHSRFHHLGQEFPYKHQNINDVCHFEIFYDEGIVGLDACTVLTHQVNVFTFEDSK